jgi:hypothetical protein
MDDSFVRRDKIDLDKVEDCPEAVAYRAWCTTTFPDILTDPTSTKLDSAMLRVAQEYNLRRKGHRPCVLSRCLLDVFHEYFDQLFEARRSLPPELLPPAGTDAPPPPGLSETIFGQEA